jgi:hypothetical protein
VIFVRVPAFKLTPPLLPAFTAFESHLPFFVAVQADSTQDRSMLMRAQLPSVFIFKWPAARPRLVDVSSWAILCTGCSAACELKRLRPVRKCRNTVEIAHWQKADLRPAFTTT